MKKILRLLITEDCNRNCPGCCNKQFDLKTLPVEDDFSGYDQIILTGGEPMLKSDKLLKVIMEIKKQNPKAEIILYTADVSLPNVLIYFILFQIQGLTVTIHKPEDVSEFKRFAGILQNVAKIKYTLSLRLNVFKDVNIEHLPKEILTRWKIKSGIEWIRNCPLPKNEVFKRMGEI